MTVILLSISSCGRQEVKGELLKLSRHGALNEESIDLRAQIESDKMEIAELKKAREVKGISKAEADEYTRKIKEREAKVDILEAEKREVESEKKRLESEKRKLESEKKRLESEKKRLESEKKKADEAAKKSKSEIVSEIAKDLDKLSPLDGKNDPGQKPAFFGNSCDQEISYSEYTYYMHMIGYLGGQFIDPHDQSISFSEAGLDEYLKKTGLRYLRGKDITTTPAKANLKHLNSCGLTSLMPPKNCWLRSAALALISEKLGDELGEKVQITSHYRPKCYNDKIKDASSSSDHILAKAMDLSIKTSDREKKKKFRAGVQRIICETLWFNENVRLSAGFGVTMIHIGIDSPQIRAGSRSWSYDDFDLKSVKGVENCYK